MDIRVKEKRINKGGLEHFTFYQKLFYLTIKEVYYFPIHPRFVCLKLSENLRP